MNRSIFGIGLLTSVLIMLLGIFTTEGASGSIPKEVADGYTLWRNYGCESCHTLFGQGGNYAPDLSHIYSLRGETYIREFMVNPAAYHPNERLMPRFTITQVEVGELIAMLRWTSTDSPIAQDWPPNPIQVVGSGGLNFNSSQASAQSDINNPLVAEGRRIYSQRCASCHSIEADVILVGPTFWNIANTAQTRISGQTAETYLRNSILYPSDFIVEGFGDLMQKNFSEVLSSTDIESLTAYLLTFDGGN